MSKEKKISLGLAIALGVGSILLYVLLYAYADQFVRWAQRTHDGEKVLFLIPIVVALVFSFVHGAFTGHFWEVLGFKAAKKK